MQNTCGSDTYVISTFYEFLPPLTPPFTPLFTPKAPSTVILLPYAIQVLISDPEAIGKRIGIVQSIDSEHPGALTMAVRPLLAAQALKCDSLCACSTTLKSCGQAKAGLLHMRPLGHGWPIRMVPAG